MGFGFFYFNESIQNIYLPNLKEVGPRYFYNNNYVQNLILLGLKKSKREYLNNLYDNIIKYTYSKINKLRK